MVKLPALLRTSIAMSGSRDVSKGRGWRGWRSLRTPKETLKWLADTFDLCGARVTHCKEGFLDDFHEAAERLFSGSDEKSCSK